MASSKLHGLGIAISKHSSCQLASRLLSAVLHSSSSLMEQMWPIFFCVDDIILTASSQPLLQRIICYLQKEFAMTNLSHLHYFFAGFCSTVISRYVPLSSQICPLKFWRRRICPLATHARLLLRFSPSCLPKENHQVPILLYIVVSHENIVRPIRLIVG